MLLPRLWNRPHDKGESCAHRWCAPRSPRRCWAPLATSWRSHLQMWCERTWPSRVSCRCPRCKHTWPWLGRPTTSRLADSTQREKCCIARAVTLCTCSCDHAITAPDPLAPRAPRKRSQLPPIPKLDLWVALHPGNPSQVHMRLWATPVEPCPSHLWNTWSHPSKPSCWLHCRIARSGCHIVGPPTRFPWPCLLSTGTRSSPV